MDFKNTVSVTMNTLTLKYNLTKTFFKLLKHKIVFFKIN